MRQRKRETKRQRDSEQRERDSEQRERDSEQRERDRENKELHVLTHALEHSYTDTHTEWANHDMAMTKLGQH